MGLMDKVKAQATQLAEKAQEGINTGQAKMEDALAKRRADSALRELGALLYLQRSGRPADEARMGALVDELKAYEAEHGPISPTES